MDNTVSGTAQPGLWALCHHLAEPVSTFDQAGHKQFVKWKTLLIVQNKIPIIYMKARRRHRCARRFSMCLPLSPSGVARHRRLRSSRTAKPSSSSHLGPGTGTVDVTFALSPYESLSLPFKDLRSVGPSSACGPRVGCVDAIFVRPQVMSHLRRLEGMRPVEPSSSSPPWGLGVTSRK